MASQTEISFGLKELEQAKALGTPVCELVVNRLIAHYGSNPGFFQLMVDQATQNLEKALATPAEARPEGRNTLVLKVTPPQAGKVGDVLWRQPKVSV